MVARGNTTPERRTPTPKKRAPPRAHRQPAPEPVAPEYSGVELAGEPWPTPHRARLAGTPRSEGAASRCAASYNARKHGAGGHRPPDSKEQAMPIHVDVKDHIATVTLDFPPVNAMAMGEYAQLMEVFDSLWEGDARVVVFTAAGDRAFCAGANIRAAADPNRRNDHGRTARECFNAIVECPIPVICAMNGAALGAGVALVASCDYIIASDKAVFALPEIDVGLMGGARHLQRIFPQNFTRWMHYTAARVPAQEAHRLGAVLRVVPHEKLMEETMAEARIIAAKMPMGIRYAKEGLNMIEHMDLKNGYRFEQTRTDLLQKTEDALEAKKAFLERRPPDFKGR